MTPTLATTLVTLSPLTVATKRQIRWLTTPEVVKYSEQRHYAHNLLAQNAYISSFSTDAVGHLWSIHAVKNNEHIGNLAATIDRPNEVAEVSILIGEPEYWGKGYGYEAWIEACRWLLRKEGGNVRKLEAGCMANNKAMLRILDKSGFQFEGERFNHFLFQGCPVGMKLYGRFR